MTSSATSTDRRPPEPRAGFQPWHFFVLLSMAGATAAVMVSRETHPAALLLLSAAVIGAGLVAVAVSYAVSGFFNRVPEEATLPPHAREALQREKALVLRSIKELEFDRAMGKLSDADFTAISTRLRARALTLMQSLDRIGVESAPKAPTPPKSPKVMTAESTCATCATKNDADARYCKNCGAALQRPEARS